MQDVFEVGQKVYLVWVDSSQKAGWRHEGLDVCPEEVESLGFIAGTTKKSVTLSSSRATGNFLSPVTIPLVAIKSHKILDI